MINTIYSLIYPIDLNYQDKMIWRTETAFLATHNQQVIYLEKALNERFEVVGYDPDDHVATRGIYIADGDQLQSPNIYTEPENDPLFIYTDAEATPVFIYTETEIDEAYSDFKVMVPAALSFDSDEMRALVNHYCDHKIFKIETY